MSQTTRYQFCGGVDTRGRLDPDVRIQVADYLRTFAGQRVEIGVRKYRAQRTPPQNRYYFGVVVKMLAEYCGYELEEMHQALAMKFLRIEDCPLTGAPRRKRTPKCDTKEFADYVDACVRLAAEHGVVIPDPNEVAA
jgi:hypothetical protein